MRHLAPLLIVLTVALTVGRALDHNQDKAVELQVPFCPIDCRIQE